MPVFEIEAPNGKTYEVEGPDAAGAMQALQRSLGQGSGTAPAPLSAPPGLRPGMPEYAQWAAQQAQAGEQLPQVSQDPNSAQAKYRDALERVRRTQFPDMNDAQWAEYSARAFSPDLQTQSAQGATLNLADEVSGIAAGIGAGARELTGGGGGGFGRAFEDVQELEQARYRLAQEQNGAAGQAVEIVSSLGAFGPGKGPISMPSLPRAVASSSASGAAIGGVQGFGASSGDLGQRLIGAADGAKSGALIGAAVPVGTAAILGAGRVGYNAIAPTVRGALNPKAEAMRQVGGVMGRDRAAGQALTTADEAIAQSAGVPLTNADRGGETTRALARSVANQNPEARATLTGLAQERYKGQSGRAVDFIRRLTGGKVDDLAYQEGLRKQADILNDRNYKLAEQSPRAQAVFTAELQELMQSPSIQRAIDMVGETGKDLAAISGQMPVQNPFRKGSDGAWRLVKKADGTLAVPSLRFWDQVKRNLDPQIEQALRGAKPNKYQASLLQQIKQKLVGSLDEVVPEYRTARQGASAAFGAEDAIDAGRIFARSPGQIPEAKRAFSKFNAAEKEAFATGYASELIDRIKIRGDSQNVIKAAFESPAAREMNELVFGVAKARQLEAYVRVEALADALRNSLGNSTTARQLVELGIGGGAGFALSGDWKGALTGAVLARGSRYAGEKVNAQVMENVAKLLTSGSRADLDRAVANATLSPQWMEALKRIEQAVLSSGGALTVSAAN